MTIHMLICALGGDDLLPVCLASVVTYTRITPDIRYIPVNTTDPCEHGRTIDTWRQESLAYVKDEDVVAIVDPDVVLLSHQWQHEVKRAFANPAVGVWGAGSQEDFGPRVHASMLCVRGALWRDPGTGPLSSFVPCLDPRERVWRDTGGMFCLGAVMAWWAVQPVERGPDWHGASAYWHEGIPMWSHLGGGTHSDPARLTWWQRLRRRQAIQQRYRWRTAAWQHLQCS